MKLGMLVGIAFSGKSTAARKLLDAGFYDIIVSTSTIREFLLAVNHKRPTKKEIFDEVQLQIENGLEKGLNVLYDATNLTVKNRSRWLAWAKQTANTEIEGIIMPCSYVNALKKNMEKEELIPNNVIMQMVKRYEKPTLDEGFDKIWHYTTLKNFIDSL